MSILNTRTVVIVLPQQELASFSVPALGLVWNWLGKGMGEHFVGGSLIVVAIMTVSIAVYLAMAGVSDLTASMVSVAFGMFLLYFITAVAVRLSRYVLVPKSQGT